MRVIALKEIGLMFTFAIFIALLKLPRGGGLNFARAGTRFLRAPRKDTRIDNFRETGVRVRLPRRLYGKTGGKEVLAASG